MEISRTRPVPTDNTLLALLPREEYHRLYHHLEPVELPAGQVVQEVGTASSHVIFLTTGLVSMNYQLQDGHSMSVALVGREGFVGLSGFIDWTVAATRAVVQMPSLGYRLSVGLVRRELKAGGCLQALALRGIQALITQMAQTAACNRHHNLDQQICRWLLLSLDRLHGNQLAMTQEQISQMLGVRREGVTAAARRLQDAGVIAYSRGRITVIDRLELEARACECYGVVRAEYDRLLPRPANLAPRLRIVDQ